jgi:SAM-dependent methyltransferase
LDAFLRKIENYYTSKLREYGGCPRGVDWKDEASQFLRFEQLLRILDCRRPFSLNDIGCGYGKLFEYMLKAGFSDFLYRGYDLSGEMIEQAKASYTQHADCTFIQIDTQTDYLRADYTVASGIFNVKQDCPEEDWQRYVLETVNYMVKASTKGAAFNFLTAYSDKDLMRADLYYADPCHIFDFCKKNFSRKIALLHDYDLFEFTILVRKV